MAHVSRMPSSPSTAPVVRVSAPPRTRITMMVSRFTRDSATTSASCTMGWMSSRTEFSPVRSADMGHSTDTAITT